MFGAIIGDIVGSVYEFDNTRTKDFDLYNEDATFTDDTVMTIAVLDALLNCKQLDRASITDVLRKWGNKYRNVGYGARFGCWLDISDPKPYGSYGNGAAMRVSPVGWIANSEEEVKELAYKVTEVSHNHPEALKAAEVVAMCVFYARTGKSKEFIKEYIEKNYDVNFDYEDLRKNYRFDDTCQGSVPQALYCFLISNSFEDCLRTTISIGGDCDTTAAISCAIAEAFYHDEDIYFQIDDYAIRKLPSDMKQVLGQHFERYLNLKGKIIYDC